MRYDLSRQARLWFPKKYDHTSWLLMNVMGRWWLLLNGWKREYRICDAERCIIVDFAHPRLMLVMEADGDRFHMDVVHEQDRDDILRGLGWSVRHYRYPRLSKHPGTVRREVKRWYWRSQITRLYVRVTRRLS